MFTACVLKTSNEALKVVQYILDLNDNRFSDGVIRQFMGNVCALSVQKFSSNVIEKCIRVAEHSTRKMLIDELLNRSRLEKLLRDSYGNYCVQVRSETPLFLGYHHSNFVQTALDYAESNQRMAVCIRLFILLQDAQRIKSNSWSKASVRYFHSSATHHTVKEYKVNYSESR